ncbi:MAG: TonB-dependent receptor [Bacteroidetes bacterium]|nr:TonB-dependent receptor [Bacteroidota bacterium]
MKKKYPDFQNCLKFRRRLMLLAGIMWLGVASMFAQTSYQYSGAVADKTGETLPGVSVVIKGTTNGAATDINGAFKLTSTKSSEVLVFSFVGYVTQEIKATADVPLKVVLVSSTVGLSELVVIGYGTQKKSVVTGAISSVKSKDLEYMPIVRIEQALQGRTTGVSVASSSGQPGASSTVRVRGTTTINNSNPLYVVDGVPLDNGGIDYLNSDDIESIEVLKDAASAAIYGTRAASGVIIVTTKKGKGGSLKVGSGSMQVSFNMYYGTQSPAKKLDLLNATDYATLRNEASVNGGGPIVFANPSSFGSGTDWQSTIFNNSAKIQNYELNISGGNDKSTYYTSIGYYSQEGVVATSISNYQRLNLRFNSAHKLKDWLRFGNNVAYSHIKSKGSLNTNSEYGGPLSSAVNLDPITPVIITDPAIANAPPYSTFPVVRDGNGNPYGISTIVVQEMTNPLAYIKTRQGNFGWSDNLIGNIYAEIEPIKGFKVRSDFGAKLAFYGDESFSPVSYLNASTITSNNSYFRASNRAFIWNWENTASYTRSFGKHNGTVLIGTSVYVENYIGVNATYKNLPVNTFEEASMNYNVVTSDRIGGGWESPDHKVSSLFARVIYNYNEKYLFTGIIRRDGSSRFGSNNRYGTFPSASIGWVASREKFWPENKVVTFVKIRGSYGVNGNDNIGDFQYLSTVGGGRNYTFGNDNYVIGYSPNAPANPDLKWEQTSQLDIGLEATFFENITLVFDWFNKKTSGMLQPVILPGYIGANGSPTGNVGSMSNKGVELELGYHKKFGEFDFKFSGNASYLKNEITDLGTVEYISGATFQSSSYEISRLAVGHPMGAFYGFEVLDIFQSMSKVQAYVDKNGNMIQPNAKPGDFRYADLNEDGKIDANDRKFIGDPTPTWSYGFTLNTAFMGFDLLVFCQGVAGNDVFNGLRRLDMPTANWTSDALGRWTGVGTSTDYPRLVIGDPNGNFSKPSTFFLTNGAYFRFKTIQLGYTFPKAIVSKIGLQLLRIYVTANNLFTITKYKGFDPEIGGASYGIDRGVYPQARSFMIGLTVTI